MVAVLVVEELSSSSRSSVLVVVIVSSSGRRKHVFFVRRTGTKASASESGLVASHDAGCRQRQQKTRGLREEE